MSNLVDNPTSYVYKGLVLKKKWVCDDIHMTNHVTPKKKIKTRYPCREACLPQTPQPPATPFIR